MDSSNKYGLFHNSLAIFIKHLCIKLIDFGITKFICFSLLLIEANILI